MALTATGALYGVTTYHTEYYGASPTSEATFRWGVEIDWDGDGVFDGTNEANRLLQFQCTRGRKNWLQPNGQGFYPLSVGTFHLTLDNYDGRYDTWNTSSPLYPNIAPGKDVRIRVVDVSTETVYNVFYGIATDIVPSGYGTNAVVKITAEDGIRFLRNNYSFGLSGGVSSQTVQDVVEYILNDCGWRWTNNIVSSAVIPYYITDTTRSAMDEINDIAQSFNETFMISASGQAQFSNRASRSFDESVILKDLGNMFVWNNYRNIVKYYWSTYGSTTLTTITYPASTTGITTPNTFSYINKWAQSSTTSDTIAQAIYNATSAKQPPVVVKFVNRPDYQFWELLDEVQIDIPTLGINAVTMLLGAIEHYGTPQEVKTTYYLEPFI